MSRGEGRFMSVVSFLMDMGERIGRRHFSGGIDNILSLLCASGISVRALMEESGGDPNEAWKALKRIEGRGLMTL